MINDKFGFDLNLVNALQDLDSLPTTEPNAVPGIPGRLYIIAPEQRKQLERIVNVLDNVPQDEFQKMTEAKKMFYSSLLNNAEVVLINSISRPARKKSIQEIER